MGTGSSPSLGGGPTEDPTRTIQTPESTPGSFIGPYQLVRQLGEGGMGVVYHAQQLQPIRRDVALKVIKPGMDSKQVISRFESERQALAMMDHPNIAHVFDAGTTDRGLPYFVMELVDGVSITRYCDSKHLTVRERIAVFIPVCKAIQHAHQKGIIHRDIKPSNVLVTQLENQPVGKVIDFGLVKALGGHISDATIMTIVGTVLGTLDYMSPEQAELGRQDIDTRTDVYSLGAVLYELLTGTTPLEHELLAKASYVEALQRVREEEPKRPSTRLRQSGGLKNTAALRHCDPAKLPKLLSQELDWIAMKALEKDRTRRYETVNGLARDLQRYLEGEPVEAAPPSAAYRTRKFVRKHRLWLATMAAFVAVLVVGVVVSTWMAVRAGRAEQEAQVVNDFLLNDLLAQASSRNQARPGTKPDPDLKVRTALDRAAARIEGKFRSQPALEASIRDTIGRTYTDLGLYSDAQQQLERAFLLRRGSRGEQHTETLDTGSHLADLYMKQGKYDQAEALLTKVLEGQRRTQGEDHPDTSETRDDLAQVYMRQGKYARAEPLYLKSVEVRRRVQGEDHVDTLASITGLATLYFYEGKYAQAEPLFTKLLEAERRVRGEDHPDTLNLMNSLAATYISQGKDAQAEPLYLKAVEARRRVLGENHPITLGSISNLADLYRVQGKYAEAESLYVGVLAIQRRLLGEEHPNTLTYMNNLAFVYLAQGKYAQAGPLFMRVLETRRRLLGEEHPETLNVLANVAELYRKQGKYDQAEALLTKVLEGQRRTQGEDHVRTGRTLASLGRLQLQQQKYSEAEIALLEALKVFKKTAPDTWARYECESMLGASLVGQKKYAEAEALIVSGYEGILQRRELIPAQNRIALDEARQRVVRLYQDWGKPEKAVEWQDKLKDGKSSATPKTP
jgi:eukaryotic-like serine/threonine-protein kinase